LLKDELLPLQAKALDPGGRESYSLDLMEYTPGPVDESLLALPSTYREEDGAQTSRKSEPQPMHER
jgi:hypothetical protein